MTTKIFRFILFALFITVSSFAQPSWQKIKTPTDFNLLKIFYLDSLHCWVAGDSGLIMFSNDQGDNWQIQNLGVSNYISDIFFLDENLGWAVTFELEGFDIRSRILKTTNGGNYWEKENYRHLNIILTTIFFEDSLNGWIGGQPFDLSYTDDGGLNWYPANVDTGSFSNFPINKIKFSASHYGFAVGGAVDVAGVVWRYNNSEDLWKAYGIAPDKFDDFIFIDSITAFALTADIERLYPIGVLDFDVKQNFWTYNELDKYGKVTSIAKRTESEFWCALGCDTSFFVSFDSRNTWQFEPTNDSICINGIAFADSLNGIAVAHDGNIFRYIPEKPVNVENIKMEIPTTFVLEQNYPNPFNPSTTIKYSIPNVISTGARNLNVILKVYDVLGNEIATLVNEVKPAGTYEIEFNSEASQGFVLTSGIYFYQLKVGDTSTGLPVGEQGSGQSFVQTKKMLLLK
ncbi:MAG TPA: YCF48-related protein [Ignavibacteriaceae bacterium]|nr:YCF48-related protein [Ignavibacteriaceae bacterium]